MSQWLDFEYKTIQLDETGEEIEQKSVTSRLVREILGKNVHLDLIEIPAGEFLMGCPPGEEGWHPSQSPQHEVTLKGFLMGKYPVTQRQWAVVAKWEAVNTELNPYPSHFEEDDRPIEQVSWWEAREFCARLAKKTGRNYNLPSESQWEYACRAHTITPFHCGLTISTDLANYSGVHWDYMGRICSRGNYAKGKLGEDRKESTSVNYFPFANPLGLYDLHGNVREWCDDPAHDNYEGAPADGSTWRSGGEESKRILRGGSWNGSPRKCRSAFRGKLDPNATLYDVGFRVMCDEFDSP
ncbi:MAG: Hercynine oxygenase [Chroococcopsis gigantea SAG 12.99]|nr:formylglycine-generating enzyme family protein [Chlorogloea purpurea SAG 13.99]MDV3000109.1 Hercynine oxygenase [Chroococcopsis gigantea SAG 12.99]